MPAVTGGPTPGVEAPDPSGPPAQGQDDESGSAWFLRCLARRAGRGAGGDSTRFPCAHALAPSRRRSVLRGGDCGRRRGAPHPGVVRRPQEPDVPGGVRPGGPGSPGRQSRRRILGRQGASRRDPSGQGRESRRRQGYSGAAPPGPGSCTAGHPGAVGTRPAVRRAGELSPRGRTVRVQSEARERGGRP